MNARAKIVTEVKVAGRLPWWHFAHFSASNHLGSLILLCWEIC